MTKTASQGQVLRAPSPAKIAAYVKAALAGGLKPGEFDVRAVGVEVAILTHAAAPVVTSEPDEQAWEAKRAQWRRSA
jgi:hypothetical protein